jgi:hypothetical protein
MSEENAPSPRFWFNELLDEAEVLEEEMNFDPEIGEGLDEDAPDWVAQILIRGMNPFGKFMGLDNLASGMSSRRFGKMLGTKVSLCTMMGNVHLLLKRLSSAQLSAFSEGFGAEEFEEARKIWQAHAEIVSPRVDDIRCAFLRVRSMTLGFTRGIAFSGK